MVIFPVVEKTDLIDTAVCILIKIQLFTLANNEDKVHCRSEHAPKGESFILYLPEESSGFFPVKS